MNARDAAIENAIARHGRLTFHQLMAHMPDERWKSDVDKQAALSNVVTRLRVKKVITFVDGQWQRA